MAEGTNAGMQYTADRECRRWRRRRSFYTAVWRGRSGGRRHQTVVEKKKKSHSAKCFSFLLLLFFDYVDEQLIVMSMVPARLPPSYGRRAYRAFIVISSRGRREGRSSCSAAVVGDDGVVLEGCRAGVWYFLLRARAPPHRDSPRCPNRGVKSDEDLAFALQGDTSTQSLCIRVLQA